MQLRAFFLKVAEDGFCSFVLVMVMVDQPVREELQRGLAIINDHTVRM